MAPPRIFLNFVQFLSLKNPSKNRINLNKKTLKVHDFVIFCDEKNPLCGDIAIVCLIKNLPRFLIPYTPFGARAVDHL